MTRKLPKPVTRFHLKPEPSRKWYYEVKIFACLEDMHAYFVSAQGEYGVKSNLNFEAITLSFGRLQLKDSRWRTHPKVGEILFHLQGCGAGIVSHECAHAMFHYAQRPGYFHHRFKNDRNLEEKMCLIQGEMVSQFWQKFYRRIEYERTG